MQKEVMFMTHHIVYFFVSQNQAGAWQALEGAFAVGLPLSG